MRTCIAAAALGLVAVACGDDAGQSAGPTTSTASAESEGALRGMTRTEPTSVADVSMPDASQGGEEFSFVAPEGGLLVVYFGYTSCPDVCPTTLADARTAIAALGDDAARIELAMVTIDPARDTPEVLTGYVQAFIDGAHALTTTDDAVLRVAADAFGADYRIEDGEDGEPLVEHSSFLYVVDDQGGLLLAWPYGQTAEDMTHDLALLLEEA